MNNLTPIPPQDPGFQLSAPVDINPAATPPPKLRLKKFLFSLRKFWWVPLITLVLALGVAVANFLTSPPEFMALGKMWQTERLQLPDGASFADDQDTYYGTMTTVLQSDPLRQLALAAMPTNAIALGKDGNPLPVEITVLQQPRSSVFFVQADSANPAYSPAYLNALMSSYLDYKKNVRIKVSGDTLSSISTQISQLEEQMKSDKQILAQYEQSNNIVLLEQDLQVAAGYLAKLKTQLDDYQLQNKLLDAVALEKNPVPTLGMTNMANPLFENLQGGSPSSPAVQSQNTYQQIESLKYQREKLSKYLRPAHPKIVKLDEQIKDAENQVDIYRRLNQQEIATARQKYKIQMDGIEQEIKRYEKTVGDDNARIAQDNNLKDNISANKGVYDRLVALMGNVDITRNIDQDNLAILQPASGSSRSYAKLKSNMSTACVAGLGFGLTIVLLITVRDDRFTSVVEVAERIGDNIVGQVPDMGKLGNNGSALALIGNNDDRHIYVESYRNLRSALLYLAVNGTRPKLLLITSAVPNEGKSTIASNLARILALGGSKVLLIDGDLRKGHLHDLFELKAKPGLAELLGDPESDNLDKYIQTSNIANLSFIARGSCGRQNPGDLFLKDVFGSLLARFREQYDYVILDSSPVFAADDSTTVAPKMDGTLFVVRNRFSRSNVVKEALDLLYQRQAIVLGLILNRMDTSGRSYHYYNYSEYHSSTETT